MSRFLDKTKQKVKKKVGQAMDRLWSSPRESRATSPAPSQQNEYSTTPASETGSQSSIHVSSSAMTQPLIAPVSVTILPLQLSNATAVGASSPSPGSDPLATPAYARPPSPTNFFTITGSAVKGLLIAVRDGSDLFLPLKAALVGVVALWDIIDVRHFPLQRGNTYSACSVLSRPRPSS